MNVRSAEGTHFVILNYSLNISKNFLPFIRMREVVRIFIFLAVLTVGFCENPASSNPKTSKIQQTRGAAPAVNSPTSFGFVPVKTIENYSQKGPSGRYIYPEYLKQQNPSSSQSYTTISQENYNQNSGQSYTTTSPSENSHNYPTYSTIPQETYAKTRHGSYQTPNYYQQTQYVQQPATHQYVQPAQEPQYYIYPQQTVHQHHQPSYSSHPNYVQYQVQAQPQAYVQPQVQHQLQYYYHPQPHHVMKNVNYITDNQVPQYVYIQHAPEPSNHVENVVDPRGQHVQYVMLIPTYVPQQVEPQSQYYYSSEQQTSSSPQGQYYRTESNLNYGKGFSFKKEPTSLLDSYIPSAMQIDYYRKLAEQANSKSKLNQIIVDEIPKESTISTTTVQLKNKKNGDEKTT